MASMDCAKTTARQDEKMRNISVWGFGVIYIRDFAIRMGTLSATGIIFLVGLALTLTDSIQQEISGQTWKELG